MHGKEQQAAALFRGELTRLKFYNAGIGDDGAEIVAAFLQHDKTVREVWFYNCNIGLLGAKAIAAALMHNVSVKNLGLGYNDIGFKGARVLIDVLAHNVCVEFAGLYKTNVGTASEASIQYLTETRNAILIPAAVRRASLFIMAIRRTTSYDGMGIVGIFPKEIVKMIAMQVFATRKDPIWIEAAENSTSAARYKIWSEVWTKSKSESDSDSDSDSDFD